MKLKHYILEDGKPKAVDIRTWLEWYERVGDVVIAEDKVDGALIQTIFTGRDCSILECSAPLIFETAIFGGEHVGYEDDASSLEDALKQHKEAIHLVKHGWDAVDPEGWT